MQRLFGGIPQYAVEKWMQHKFMGVKGKEAIAAKRFDVITNFAYKYLSTVVSGFQASIPRQHLSSQRRQT
eukprot:2107725-Prymnesium_polylepis.1